jgi:hypothetical protein
MNWDTIQKLPIKSRLNYELKKERKKKRKEEKKLTAFAAFVAPISTLLDLVADLLCRQAFLSALAPEQTAVLVLLQLFFRGEKIMNDFSKTHELKRNIWDV